MKAEEQRSYLSRKAERLADVVDMMIGDMKNLSCLNENRTEFSDELQSQIEKWEEEIVNV